MIIGRTFPALAACILSACGGREALPRVSAEELRAAAPALSVAVPSSAPRGCAQGGPVSVPFDALVVTGLQCLSCMDVGYAVRWAARDARARGTAFTVVAPVGDSATVCAALRRERAARDVLLVADSLVPWKDGIAPLLYLQVARGTASAPVTRVAGEGVALVDSIEGARRASLADP